MVFYKKKKRETLDYLIKGKNVTIKFRIISRYKNHLFHS